MDAEDWRRGLIETLQRTGRYGTPLARSLRVLIGPAAMRKLDAFGGMWLATQAKLASHSTTARTFGFA